VSPIANGGQHLHFQKGENAEIPTVKVSVAARQQEALTARHLTAALGLPMGKQPIY